MTISWTSRIGSHGARPISLAAVATVAALVVAACGSAVGASMPPAGGPVAATAVPAETAAGVAAQPAGAPVAVPGNGGSGVSNPGTVSSGVAIAYPYPGYPGSPGLAPDHTIVVTGFGRAPVAADMSDRATAQPLALKAALADAKAQADLVASATGVTIQGVLSVSVSSTQGFYGPVPMGVDGSPPNGGTTAPARPVPPPGPGQPTLELDVAVTVAYRIG